MREPTLPVAGATCDLRMPTRRQWPWELVTLQRKPQHHRSPMLRLPHLTCYDETLMLTTSMLMIAFLMKSFAAAEGLVRDAASHRLEGPWQLLSLLLSLPLRLPLPPLLPCLQTQKLLPALPQMTSSNKGPSGGSRSDQRGGVAMVADSTSVTREEVASSLPFRRPGAREQKLHSPGRYVVHR